MTHRPDPDPRRRPPPWLVITLAAIAIVVIASAVILVVAGYTAAEIATGIGELALRQVRDDPRPEEHTNE